VRYLAPTPIGVELELRSKIEEMHRRKAIVSCSVFTDGKECAIGEVVAVRASFE
jgi:predicted thioesterase